MLETDHSETNFILLNLTYGEPTCNAQYALSTSCNNSHYNEQE